MANEILKMEHITKVYPNGIVANKDVNLSVNACEIHAIAGENGAGKSTLMNILFGIQNADEGAIYVNGKQVEIKKPEDAIKNGIGMVHQHFMLVPSLTVAENVFLGMEPKKYGLVDKAKAIALTEEISKKYNLAVDARKKVTDISVGMKQKVEILKVLVRGAKILILDEPTAVLTPQETDELFKELLLLNQNGHTIIFISHKLQEIKAICNRITIMRGGRTMGVHNVADVSEEDISRLMVGRDVVLKIEKKKCNSKEKVLEIQSLNMFNELGKQTLNNVSLSVRAGEILGIAGVEGNGQEEIVGAISGLLKTGAENIKVCGKSIDGMSIKQIRKTGISLIPEDRMAFGVAAEGTIEENLISDKIGSEKLNKGLLQDSRAVRKYANQMIGDYKIKCDFATQPVNMLSGGNIQKVIVAREISSQPKLLIADQPSRGVDVGATEFIHKKLVELRDGGAAILLVSADLNEVIELSDSLIVMYNGEISAYFEDSSKVSEEELGFYMLGVKKQTPEQIRRIMHEC